MNRIAVEFQLACTFFFFFLPTFLTREPLILVATAQVSSVLRGHIAPVSSARGNTQVSEGGREEEARPSKPQSRLRLSQSEAVPLDVFGHRIDSESFTSASQKKHERSCVVCSILFVYMDGQGIVMRGLLNQTRFSNITLLNSFTGLNRDCKKTWTIKLSIIT